MFVHRSNRLEELVEVLAGVLARPLGSPFDAEIVLVASKGMERWLSLELSRRLGICSGVAFPFPRAFVERLMAETLDGGDAPEPAAFSRESLTWTIAALLPELEDRPNFRPVKHFLAGGDLAQRFELAERIGHVFDQYAVYRPDLIQGFQAGGDDWQACLFREVEARLGKGHLAARADRFFAAWSAGQASAGLPPRLSVFGVSSLPPVYVRLLAALAERLPVHLFVLTASREYLGDLAHPARIARELHRQAGGAAPGTLHLGQGHPLLATLGTLGRDLQQVLETSVDYRESEQDLFRDPGRATMLSTLQSDLLHLRHRRAGNAEAPPLPVARADRSVQVHACHSRLREVEVLRDQLLGAFSDDPTLEPQDVLVMMPEVEHYAPLIEAVFGVEPGRRDHIPYRISDRVQRSESPVVDALLSILAAARGRMKASEVLDLLGLEPVRRQANIGDDELERVRHWIHDAGIRWGVDAADRGTAEQPPLDENTWRFGLRRLLLGYAAPSSGGLFCGCLPYDVEGDAAETLGNLVEFCERLFAWRARLRTPKLVPDWVEQLSLLLGSMLAPAKDAEWELQLVRDSLADLGQSAAVAGFGEPIGLEVIESILTARFSRERAAHAFLSGGVTFCAMLPMRSIPFRHIYLLGMNDGEYPRTDRSPSFDRLRDQRRPGDRSVREEDRYLFLEALVSARERFVVSYIGRGLRDDAEYPPSVVVGQLLDCLSESFRIDHAPPAASGKKPRARAVAQASERQLSFAFDAEARPDPDALLDHVIVEHPLQAFSARYFNGADPRLFSFGTFEAAAARAVASARTLHPPLLTEALPAPNDDPLRLERLALFFENPCRAFFREQLGTSLKEQAELVEDREPLDLDPLDRYAVGNCLLQRAVAGDSPAQQLAYVRAAGLLPPGSLGALDVDALLPEVLAISAHLARWRTGEALPPLDVQVPIRQRALAGVLRDLWPAAQVFGQYSRVRPKRLLRLWVLHLALQLSGRDGTPRTTLLVGRAPDSTTARAYQFSPLPPARAGALLEELCSFYELGLRHPLPLFPESSFCYASRRLELGEERALATARELFIPHDLAGGKRGEADDEYVGRAFAADDPFRDDWRGPSDHGPCFAELAVRVFDPLLDALHIEELG